MICSRRLPKKWISAFLVICLFITSGIPALGEQNDNRLKLYSHDKYMTGINGLFYPERTVSKAELASVFYTLLKDKPKFHQSYFTDIDSESQYALAVGAIADIGALTGNANGSYYPDSKVTRAELIQALAFFFKPLKGRVPFEDVKETNRYYSAIVTAFRNGWIKGEEKGDKVYFFPNKPITRSELTVIINTALMRTQEGFAANIYENKFPDVPDTHWAFYHIIEAAQPDKITKPISEVKTLAESGLPLRAVPEDNGTEIVKLPLGTILTVLEGTMSLKWMKVQTMTGVMGYVESKQVQPFYFDTGYEDDVKELNFTSHNGSGSMPDNSWSPSSSVGGASDVIVSDGAMQIPLYKTLYLGKSNSGLIWKSSDDSVAVASNGFIYAKGFGSAVITEVSASGQMREVCKVNVTSPDPVRFAYTDENVPAAGSLVNLLAVTDESKTSVKFEITGAETATYETSVYTSEFSAADTALPSNFVKIWSKPVVFPKAGIYDIKVYSMDETGKYSGGYTFSVLAVSSSNSTATSYDSRRASTEIIKIIGSFESYMPCVYPDMLAGGIPTVGYGFVVNKNKTFYNNLTKTEAMAMLVDTVNRGYYAAAVESFRSRYGLKMSQSQFDALTSFVYNLGPGALNANYEICRVILNASAPPRDLSDQKPYPGEVNTSADIQSVLVYRDANESAGRIASIPNGSQVLILDFRMSAFTNEGWYKAMVAGRTGWVRSGHIRFKNSNQMERDLSFVDSKLFGDNLVQWCNAGGNALWGLYYRRQAEARLFSTGNYADAYPNSPNYKVNPGYTVPSGLR